MNKETATINDPMAQNRSVMGSTGINSTVIIPYEDCNRMIAFCKDKEKNISRDFYDWYLHEKPEYFVKKGMLVIDDIENWKERSCISFDFSDSDNVLFCLYAYSDQSKVCEWRFNRQDNITMKDIEVGFDYLSITNFKKIKFSTEAYYKAKTDETEEHNKKLIEKLKGDAIYNVDDEINKTLKNGFKSFKKKDILDKALRNGYKELLKSFVVGLNYFVYALMYYISKQDRETIEANFFKTTDLDTKTVKAIYKYTGYVDLRENKIYKPTIERNPDDPVRDYHRHIQAWTVRGHYRKTKNGLIWIEPHIKGSGELEKRIYGTEDEKDLNLIPKIFEVERTVKLTSEIKVVAPKEKEESKGVIKKEKVSLFRKLLKFLGW